MNCCGRKIGSLVNALIYKLYSVVLTFFSELCKL